MFKKMFRCLLRLMVIRFCIGAKILGVFFIPCKSHQSVYHSIWSELSLRGHEVTVFTPIPQKNASLTNLTEIDLSEKYNELLTSDSLSKMLNENNLLMYRHWTAINNFQSVVEIHLSKAKQLFSKEQTFDLILLESQHPLVYAFGCRFNVPIIGMSSLGVPLGTFDAIGNPAHPSVNPGVVSNFADYDNFFERLSRFAFLLWYRVFYYWYLLPKSNKIAQNYYPKCPFHIREIEKNVSLILSLNNPILHPVRPNVPSFIELDRVHLKPYKPLPLDLKHYLDNSPQGVVYFSLGNSKNSSNLPDVTKQIIFTTLSQLPYNVLLKWDSNEMTYKSKNIFLRSSFPQQDLLRHKNIKVFVSQMGLQSMEEAVTNEVPLVGIPFSADQPANVLQVIKMGIGLGLDSTTMTSHDLKHAILEVAQNKKYKENIVKVRKLLDDQPIRGLTKAIWWIEYVIRHNGAKHLRSPLVDLPWYQYLLLDVLCFVILLSFIVLFVSYKIVKLFSKNNKKKVKKQ